MRLICYVAVTATGFSLTAFITSLFAPDCMPLCITAGVLGGLILGDLIVDASSLGKKPSDG